MADLDFSKLAQDIKAWSADLGFQETAITDADLSLYKSYVKNWVDKGFHGKMSYMARNMEKRCDPEKLLPGTFRIISVRMDYAKETGNSFEGLYRSQKAYISRYARGRDYHKLIRKRLQSLARKIVATTDRFGYRGFVDSAPVLERALAEKAGLGWIGKNTMLINKNAGSWFFLGELFTNLPLPVDSQTSDHCGSCSACLDVCPTKAFIGPNLLDATRCISYLTIELREAIPIEFRSAIGNRIFGCDDCQLICPWNKFAKHSNESDFSPRHSFDDIELTTLFSWSEEEFLERTEGSPIRRIGYDCWRRNIAVALGNAKTDYKIVNALQAGLQDNSAMVREHVDWALSQHT